MECPVCGKTCDPDDRYCRYCGEQLAEEQPRGRFRPLFQKTQDQSGAWDNHVRPFLTVALICCMVLLSLAGIGLLIERILHGK
jgi:predicted nucleic acid-binding Zn ribbon protein